MERVGEASRSRRRRTEQPRKSLAESPPSQLPKSSQKKRKSGKQTSSQYYSVREIVSEKIEHGEISYLIDWEDNAKTGESYAPTWEPYDNVTKEAIDDWLARRGPTRIEKPRRFKDSTAQPTSSFVSDSQPIRTTKRQRTTRPQSSPSFGQPLSKKPRRAGTVDTARFQSVSQETADSQRKPKEIKDSYEEQSPSYGSGRIRVEIPVDEAFDRDAYSKVAAVCSQPSQTTQSSQRSQLSCSPDTFSRSQKQSSNERPIIWSEDEEDEEADRVPIIQDSQFVPGSSSYVPSHTPASNIGVTLRSDIETESDFAISSSLARVSVAAVNSTGSSYQHSGPQIYRSGASKADNSELKSDRLDSGGQVTSPVQRQASTFLHRSEESYIFEPSSNLESSRDFTDSSNPSSRPETSHSTDSADILAPLEGHLPPPTRGNWSQEASPILSQVQSQHRSYSWRDESSLQFQTQVPLATQVEVSPSKSSHHVRRGFISRTLSRQSIRSEERQSQTSSPDALVARSLAPYQGSICSVGGTWEAAQVVSASPQVYTQQEQISFDQGQRSSPIGTLNATARTAIPPLSNVDTNTQKSPSKSLDRPSSETEIDPKFNNRDRHREEPSENVLSSIEPIVDPISSPLSGLSPSPGFIRVSHSYESFSTRSSRRYEMADQVMGEMSTAEKLRRVRTAAAERKMAEQRAARNASAIPHTPPPPTNQMLPLRETAPEAAVASAEAVCSPKASPQSEEAPSKVPQLLPLGENVFTVPLPMVSLARDIYDQEITNYRPQRRVFLGDEKIDRSLVEDIDKMLERLKLICDHQDLIDADSASQAMEPEYRQAKWAENISTKCMFLAEFFNSLRSLNTHIVLLVRSGRMMDILEALFRTHGYRYSRPDRSPSETGQGLMKISLLPTNVDPRSFNVQPASLLIAFDSSFVKEPWVDALRTDPTNLRRLAPLAYLVITHSIEHLDLCINKNMAQLDRMAILVNSLSVMRDEVGKLDSSYPPPDSAAKLLAEFVIGGTQGEWPLLPMPTIEGIEILEPTTEVSNEAHISGSTTQSYDLASSSIPQATFKRSLIDQDILESSKRQRLTPVDGVSSSGINVSRGDEPSLGATSKADTQFTETRESEALDTAQDDQVSSLLKKLAEFDIQLRAKEITEIELRQSNERLEARVQDYEKSIEKIQPKYQEALNDRGQAAHDIVESMARETSMRQKLETRTAELAKVREEKALANTELEAARSALSNSSIPEIAEMQKLKDELSAAKLDVEKAQKKINNCQNDMEYMRNNYQKASSAAAEMRNELDELKSRNAVLERKASDNAVEIHRIQSASEIRQYLQLISELEVEKSELERELEKKSEELRTLLNGRRTTRGTSVPRSPRMGTMSPGQASRPMVRVLGGVGSRGNSPAPGSSESGFRGPGTFGDALFAPPGAANRWGNHLS